MENGNLTMAYPHTCSGNTVVASLMWKAEGGSSPKSFCYGNLRNIEQTTAKESSQSTAVGQSFNGDTGKKLGGLKDTK